MRKKKLNANCLTQREREKPMAKENLIHLRYRVGVRVKQLMAYGNQRDQIIQAFAISKY